MRILRYTAWGTLITVFLVFVGLSLAPPEESFGRFASVAPPHWNESPPDYRGLLGRYRRFFNWDSAHYYSIAETGYHITSDNPPYEKIHNYENNIGFFPGYPLVTAFFKLFLPLPTELVMLLVAQLFSILAWVYFFFLLDDFKIAGRARTLVTLFVLTYPTLMYLVVGYTESVFIANLLGMLFWMRRVFVADASKWVWAPLLMHCFLTAITRPTSLPIVIAPLVFAFFAGLSRKSGLRALLLVSFLGCSVVSYFAYLYFKFGSAQIFFTVHQNGWSDKILPFSFFNPLQHLILFFRDPNEYPDCVSRLYVLGWSSFFVYILFSLKRIRSTLQDQTVLAVVVVSFLMYALAFVAQADRGLGSMIRYTLGVAFMMALFIGVRLKTPLKPATQFGVGIFFVAQWILQFVFFGRFLWGRWLT